MRVEPVVLEGRRVRLDPLQSQHAEALHEVTDYNVFRYFTTWPLDDSLEAMQRYIEGRMASTDAQSYVLANRENGCLMGCTSFLDIRPAHRGLEIGGTWVAATFQGTHVNPECKYLLMRHAFEDLGTLRVQLKCDARNRQSQAAIAKLGAVREGVLRRHMVLQDGFVRDTVMFSITDNEWPAVKRRLEERLGYTP